MFTSQSAIFPTYCPPIFLFITSQCLCLPLHKEVIPWTLLLHARIVIIPTTLLIFCCLSFCMFLCLFACLSLSLCLFICLSAYLFYVCLSVCLLDCVSVCPSVCLCLSVHISPSLRLFVCLFSVCLCARKLNVNEIWHIVPGNNWLILGTVTPVRLWSTTITHNWEGKIFRFQTHPNTQVANIVILNALFRNNPVGIS